MERRLFCFLVTLLFTSSHGCPSVPLPHSFSTFCGKWGCVKSDKSAICIGHVHLRFNGVPCLTSPCSPTRGAHAPFPCAASALCAVRCQPWEHLCSVYCVLTLLLLVLWAPGPVLSHPFSHSVLSNPTRWVSVLQYYG